MANVTDKSILTAAGKALLAQLNAEEKPLVIDKMIFANVPNRPEYPQPDDVVPSNSVVHEAAVEQRGRLSVDSVIYSTTLTSQEGPFEFNWTGAYCSEYGVLVTIDHHALTPKTADEPGVAGNTLVRSVVLEYKDIAEITNITVDASTWQYNATPRMKKMDDDVAQSIIDQNGKDWFIEDGFLVTPQASAFNIKAGAGYVSGNRVTLEFDRNVQVPNKPSFIYVDAHREGTPTGEQITLFDFVVTAEEKDDYTDVNDVKHFVCKIAQVMADGSVSDLRPEGEQKKNEYKQTVMLSGNLGFLSGSAESLIGKEIDGHGALEIFDFPKQGDRSFFVIAKPPLSGQIDGVNLSKSQVVIGGKKHSLAKMTPNGAVTLDQFGSDGLDDTLALDAACAFGMPIDMQNKTYIYKASSHEGVPTLLAKTIFGQGWVIKCEGPVQFDMPDDHDWTGGRFESDNVFNVDPSVPRHVAPKSVMLISNAASGSVRPITRSKIHCDFVYSAAVDGTRRGEGFVRIAGDTPCDMDFDGKMSGCILGLWSSSNGGKLSGKFVGHNYETGVITASGQSLELDLKGYNTPTQQKVYRATDEANTLNGKDLILTEATGKRCESVEVKINSHYAVERGGYLQQVGGGKVVAWAIGSDAGKCTDASEDLEIYATAIFPKDTGPASRYSWQVYGDSHGPVKKIDLYPKLYNYTGEPGNKECFSVLGHCENITVHEPFGYDCGNGLWLAQMAGGGKFTPKIDGLTINGGRAAGPNGKTPANGAVTAFFDTPLPDAYIRNLTINGTSSMPSLSGNSTFLLKGIEGFARLIDCKVDGVNTAKDYDLHVVAVNCENLNVDAKELMSATRDLSYSNPLAVQRTDLAINGTSVIPLTQLTTPANPAKIEVEIEARHNGQPLGNFIHIKGVFHVGSTNATSVFLPEINQLASSQTVSFVFDEATNTVNLHHTSSSPLGFDDSTFYSMVRSTRPILTNGASV